MDMLIASGSELSVDLRGTSKIMHACHKGLNIILQFHVNSQTKI